MKTTWSEHCAIGLHQFGDWRDEGEMQVRSCVACGAQERRRYQRPPPRSYDPYADI